LNRDVAFPEKILLLSSGKRFSILTGDTRRISLSGIQNLFNHKFFFDNRDFD